MHSRALPATHVAPQSSKASGAIKVMPLFLKSSWNETSGQEPMRTRGAPAHVKRRPRSVSRGARVASQIVDAPAVSPDQEQQLISLSVQH